MNPHFERAELLYRQSRYDTAEDELRRCMADDPDFAPAHALLALCMLARESFADATDCAQRAVGMAPDVPFPHYVLAQVMMARNRFEEAEQSARQAVELNPYSADLHQMLGDAYFAQRRWPSALEEAEEGLRLDAEHIGCANLRAMALVKLGRKDEADKVLEGVLARDPEDGYSHANQGWTALHQNDPKKALEHFREALRLEPTLEFAQAGMVEALKARYFIYRLMLRWFLWMSSLGRRWQWVFILVLFFSTRIIRNLAQDNPNLGPILWPMWGILIGFSLMTWIADPLFNLMLRMNRYGRHILNRDQIRGANAIGICILAAVAFLAYGLIENQFVFLLMALVTGVYLLVVAGYFKVPPGKHRALMGAGALFLAGVAAYAFWLIFEKRVAESGACLNIYFPGILVYSIGANVLMGLRQER